MKPPILQSIGNSASDSLANSLKIVVSILLLLLVGISFNSLSPGLRVYGTSIYSGIAIVLLSRYWGTPLKFGWMELSFLLFLSFESITLSWTPFPQAAAEVLVVHALMFVFFLLIRLTLFKDWTERTWLDGLVLLGVAIVLLELLQVGLWLDAWFSIAGLSVPPIGYRSSGLIFGHPNVFAGFLNLIMPFALLKVLRGNDWMTRFKQGALFVFLGIGLFFTSSRGGWLAGLAGLSATLFFFFILQRDIRRRLSLRDADGNYHAGKILGLILLAAAIIAIGSFGYWQATRTGHASPVQARLPVWQGTAKLITDSPIQGSGLRSFPPTFAGLSIDHHEEDIPHAHNILLQYWAELGILGILFLAFFFLLIALRVYHNMSIRSRSEKLDLIPLIGALTAVGSHHLFDFILGSPLYLGSVLIILAIATQSKADPSIKLRTIAMWQVGTVALTLMATAILVLLQSDNWLHWRGVQAANEGNWAAATNILCLNSKMHPTSPAIYASCQIARELSPDSYQRTVPSTIAAELDPNWHHHWENAAHALYSNGQIEEALSAQRKTIELAPHREEAYLGLAYFLEQTDQPSNAADVYRQALEENAAVLDSFLMNDSDVAMAVAEEYSLGRNPEEFSTTWLVMEQLRTGDYDGSLQLLENASSSYRQSYIYYLLLAESYIGMNDLMAAEEALQIGEFIRPDSLRARWLRSRLEEQLGNQAEADRLHLDLLESIIISTNSRRYFFAAYGRASLPIDQVPGVLRGELTEEIITETLELDERISDPYSQSIILWTLESAGLQ